MLFRSIIALVLVLASVGANAAVVARLAEADLAGFDTIGGEQSNVGFQATTYNGALRQAETEVFFAKQGDGTAGTGPYNAAMGLTGVSLDFSGADEFQISLANVNENPWDFRVTVKSGGTVASTTVSSFPNNNPAVFTPIAVDLSGFSVLELANITDIFIGVYNAGLPGAPTAPDRVAEFKVRVPAPGTIAILGLGLVALGLLRRKNVA